MEIASSHSAILQILFFHVNLEAFVVFGFDSREEEKRVA